VETVARGTQEADFDFSCVSDVAFANLLRFYLVAYLFIYLSVLQIESRDHIGDDTKLITISIVAMLVLATVAGWSCRHPCACADGGHVTLAYMGVVATLLAILGAFGLLSLLGSRFVNLSSVMPFLVLGNNLLFCVGF